jgi:hypothetical protein
VSSRSLNVLNLQIQYIFIELSKNCKPNFVRSG